MPPAAHIHPDCSLHLDCSLAGCNRAGSLPGSRHRGPAAQNLPAHRNQGQAASLGGLLAHKWCDDPGLLEYKPQVTRPQDQVEEAKDLERKVNKKRFIIQLKS